MYVFIWCHLSVLLCRIKLVLDITLRFRNTTPLLISIFHFRRIHIMSFDGENWVSYKLCRAKPKFKKILNSILILFWHVK